MAQTEKHLLSRGVETNMPKNQTPRVHEMRLDDISSDTNAPANWFSTCSNIVCESKTDAMNSHNAHPKLEIKKSLCGIYRLVAVGAAGLAPVCRQPCTTRKKSTTLLDLERLLTWHYADARIPIRRKELSRTLSSGKHTS